MPKDKTIKTKEERLGKTPYDEPETNVRGKTKPPRSPEVQAKLDKKKTAKANPFNPTGGTNNCADIAFQWVTGIPLKKITKAFGGPPTDAGGRSWDEITEVGEREFGIQFARSLKDKGLQKYLDMNEDRVAAAFSKASKNEAGEDVTVGHCLLITGGTSERNFSFEDDQGTPAEEVTDRAMRDREWGRIYGYMYRPEVGDEASEEEEDSADEYERAT